MRQATGDGRQKTHADNATILDVHLHLELVLGDRRRVCAVRPDRHHFVRQGCVGRESGVRGRGAGGEKRGGARNLKVCGARWAICADSAIVLGAN